MRCLSPRKVAIGHDGRITFSTKNYNKEFAPFAIPCSKCIECRLENARQWAIRSVHEAQMYENNIFLTLTYNDENLPKKLEKRDFQLFMKSLRKKIFKDFLNSYGQENWKLLDKQEQKTLYNKIKIGVHYVGEYGEKTKRPHWHAIIFNYAPDDKTYKYSTDSGDRVYKSESIDTLWNKGHTEFGSVTFESAGYVSRYSAKKLVHGNDGQHDFNPVPGKSSHQAIGKKWLEKYYKDIFNYGQVILSNGQKCAIPRYYEKWLAKNHPSEFQDYVLKIKHERQRNAEQKQQSDLEKEHETQTRRFHEGKSSNTYVNRQKARTTIINQKFNKLQKHLKGDI